MEDFRVEIDGDIDDRVLKLPEVHATAKEAANIIANAARDIAPVVTGDYKAGIVTQETKMGWRVLAADQKSAWVEFGVPADGEPAQFVLRRAVEASGFKFKKRSG